jgi:NADH-quinone oxidoreductase subunit F
MEKPLTQHASPQPMDLRQYEAAGGYQALRKALTMSPTDIQAMVKKAEVKGRGGGGFSAGLKWSFMPMGPDAPRPKYLCVNADEMEPGTFKDRLLLERTPHAMVESALVTALAIEASEVYIFLRAEYTLAAARLRAAIAQAADAGYCDGPVMGKGPRVNVRLHTSAGRYMCGEETGLINALEGKRATPRAKPPHPVTVGLWGKPTVVNNVETLCCVPHIVLHGAEWFHSLSRAADSGTKLYGVSGPVKRPGLWELPMGTPLGEILGEHAGGMLDGRRLRAVIPGGASTGMLLPDQMDVAMDFTNVARAGTRLGTGTMIVIDDRTCMVGLMLNLQRFFAVQSCGWCTPCREGLPWLAKVLEDMEAGLGRPQDMEILDMHVRHIRMGNTFCALAPGAMEPLEAALKHFRQDFIAHIDQKRCPWRKQ